MARCEILSFHTLLSMPFIGRLTIALADYLDKLRHFCSVADARSFSAAARTTRVSQPNLSKAVQDLEQHLEVQLLVRTPKGVRLTEEGEILQAFSHSLASDCRAIEERIRKASQSPTGELRIASYPALAAALFPKFAGKIATLNRGIKIQMRTSESSAVLEAWVMTNDVDIAIVVDGKRSPKLAYNTYAQVEYGAYIGNRERTKGISQQRSSSRPKIPWAFVGDTFAGSGDDVEATLRRIHAKVSLMQVESHDIAKGLALAGYAVAILPGVVAQPYVDTGTLKRVKGIDLRHVGKHDLLIATLPKHEQRPIVRFIADHIDAVV